MAQEVVVAAIEAALALHCERIGVVETDPEIRVWHMIASLLEYCDAQSPVIDFDLNVEDVREFFKSEGRDV